MLLLFYRLSDARCEHIYLIFVFNVSPLLCVNYAKCVVRRSLGGGRNHKLLYMHGTRPLDFLFNVFFFRETREF